MNEVAKKRIDTGALTTGIVLITFGLLFLLSKLDIADFDQVVRRHWPLIIIVVGVTKLFSRETVWSGLWFIVVGSWLQIAHLEMFELTYGSSWPLLLIALGAGIVLRAFIDSVSRRREENHEG